MIRRSAGCELPYITAVRPDPGEAGGFEACRGGIKPESGFLSALSGFNRPLPELLVLPGRLLDFHLLLSLFNHSFFLHIQNVSTLP